MASGHLSAIYFSRYARPYGLAMVLGFVAIVAFCRWWSGGGRLWGWLYASCAIAGPYFHLTVLPFSLSPLLVALAWELVRGGAERWRSSVHILGMGCVVAVGLAVLLSPRCSGAGAPSLGS